MSEIVTPYETVGDIVEKWCKSHFYGTMLVTISQKYDFEKSPRISTEILEFDAEAGRMIWDSDWWEGEPYVSLCGFAPLSWLRFDNAQEMLEGLE